MSGESGRSEIGLSNFSTLNTSGITIGSLIFLFLLIGLSAIWKYFIGLGIDLAWAQTYINLSVVTFFFLVALSLIAILLTRSLKFVPGIPFGKTDVGSIVLAIFVALIIAGLFSVTSLSFAPLSFLPQSVYSLSSVVDFAANQFQIFVFMVNYAVIPAVDEEIFVMVLILFTAIVLNLVFNRSGDLNKAIQLNMLALLIGFSIFGIFHYNSYINDLTVAWKTYNINPTLFVQSHPNTPIPVDPSTVGFYVALLVSLGLAMLFKFANSSAGIFFDALWIMILAHFFNNGFLLVFNPALLTYGAFPQLILLSLMLIFGMFLQSLFERTITVGEIKSFS